jgi:hypothetical protein
MDQHCDTLFELFEQWTVVAQPSAIKDLVDPAQKGFSVAQVGPADVQRLRESRRAHRPGQ